jgi:hypothetical protein
MCRQKKWRPPWKFRIEDIFFRFYCDTNQIINANWRMTSIQAGHNPFISLYANIYTPQVHKMIAARIWVVFYTSINVGIDGNFNLETTHVTRGVDTEKTWRLK